MLKGLTGDQQEEQGLRWLAGMRRDWRAVHLGCRHYCRAIQKVDLAQMARRLEAAGVGLEA